MKRILWALVALSALVSLGVAGTLAGFSDTEISRNNFFEVGSLDLTVSDAQGTEYDDPLVPALVEQGIVWPSATWRYYDFDMHSLSEPDGESAYAYIRFKELTTGELTTSTKHPDGRPEPEVVAETGGELANRTTSPISPLLEDYLEVLLYFDTNGDGTLELILGDPTGANPVMLSDIIASDIDHDFISVGQIPACNTRDGQIGLRLQNQPEEAFALADIFPNDMPFNDWPTNAFQLDYVNWNIEFALTQDPIPAAYLLP